ncbi:MAG: glycosyltransferase family 4 protein [Candidatus Eisenbacteria bacterium]
MRIATFLPHVGVFGGVRRFLELGNEWVARGHEVTLYHPDGSRPAWLEYRGRVAALTAAATETSDVAVCADPHTYGTFRAHESGRHVYYCVIEGDAGLQRALADPAVTLAANSGALREKLAGSSGRPVLDGVGGIRTTTFRPEPALRAASPLRVLVNGRRSRPKKGTDLVLRALKGLVGKVPAFEVVLFDSVDAHNRQDPRDGAPLPPNARFVLGPTQEELVALYQSSHLFVAAERKAGWCNTALEALACGCAVVCTRSGTRDFAVHERNALVSWRHEFFLRRAIKRVLTDAPLRDRLAAAGPASAEPWAWPVLAEKLLRQF